MTPESPFAPLCSRAAFLETVAGGALLRRLDDGLGAREPFLLLTGEPGTGKTTLVREAIARWDARVAPACLAYSSLSGAELLEEIVRRFGADPAEGASRPKLVACFELALESLAAQGKVAMLVVDDAHGLPAELLEELRLLVNAAQQGGWPFEVLLAGLPALEQTLEQPALAPLRQRVSVRARLEPLPAGEIRRYLRHRVDAAGGDGATLFPRRTCNEVVGLSLGVPRRINALAAEALRLATAAGEASVQQVHVQDAARALWGSVPAHAAPLDDDDATAEDAKAKSAAPAATSKAPGPALEVKPATTSPSAAKPARVPAPAPSSAPRAEVPTAAAARLKPVAAPAEETSFAPPPPPVRQDPHEWVARFVGDKGPVRIGSQAAGSFAVSRALAEPFGEDATGAAAKPGLPALAAAAPPARSRRRRGGALRVASWAALATCAVIATFVLFNRAKGPASAKTVVAAAVQPAEKPAAPAPRRQARTQSAAPVVSIVKPAGEAAGTESDPAGPLKSPTGRWTLEVGSAASLDRAFEERDRMEELAGIEGWIVPAPEGSTAPVRVVLGIYRSHERASAAAKMLLASKTLPAVRVVPLPRRADRR